MLMMVDLGALSIWLQSWMCPREREKKMPPGFNHFCCHQYRVLGSYQDLCWKKKFKCKKQPKWTYLVHKLTWIVVMDDSNHQGIELGRQWLFKVIDQVIMSWNGVEGQLHIGNGKLLFSYLSNHTPPPFWLVIFGRRVLGFPWTACKGFAPLPLTEITNHKAPKKKGLQSGVWPWMSQANPACWNNQFPFLLACNSGK